MERKHAIIIEELSLIIISEFYNLWNQQSKTVPTVIVSNNGLAYICTDMP